MLQEMRNAVFLGGLVAGSGSNIGAYGNGLNAIHAFGHNRNTSGQAGNLDRLIHDDAVSLIWQVVSNCICALPSAAGATVPLNSDPHQMASRDDFRQSRDVNRDARASTSRAVRGDASKRFSAHFTYSRLTGPTPLAYRINCICA
jgi:hypothetical protein